MLKKLRRQFILSAMLAFGLVMLVLITAINVLNASGMRRSQNKQIERILEYEQMTASEPEPLPIREMPWAGGENREFTTRFFVVRCDESGVIRSFGNEYIFSVNTETAETYSKEVLNAGKDHGSYGDFSYRIAESEEGDDLIIVFLNVSEAEKYQKALLLASLLTGALSLVCVFGLVMLLSRLAMRPYLRNMEMQKRFITDAGHELKTPITSISTSADILAMEHEHNEWITNIQHQAERLRKLVNDLITLSRLDEEVPFPEVTVFSLSEVCWETAESFLTRAKAEGKTFETEIRDNIDLQGDRDAIQKMLTILLDNAIKYASDGGEIRLCLAKKNGRAAVEVRNSCEADLSFDVDRLFERFYRPDESRSTETGGTGLGLSIAKAIVERHKGEITMLTSEKGAVICRVIL